MTTFQTPGPITAFVEIGSGDINVTASDRVDSVVTIFSPISSEVSLFTHFSIGTQTSGPCAKLLRLSLPTQARNSKITHLVIVAPGPKLPATRKCKVTQHSVPTSLLRRYQHSTQTTFAHSIHSSSSTTLNTQFGQCRALNSPLFLDRKNQFRQRPRTQFTTH